MSKRASIFSSYKSVLDFLYTQLPMFQRVGGAAYKKDLTNTIALCEALGNPQNKFKSVHIAGTNGKGSCSHYTASILQAAGYKTGLYTSPHLKNFTERIKIDGHEMPPQAVMDFVNTHRVLIEEVKPSFFEITVAMAFDFFAKEQVDIAVVEVGMGGRLDSTNVITPEVSLITNISKDHEQWLGEGMVNIAREKGGIIKRGIPVIISEKQVEVAAVFEQIAAEKQAPVVFAEEHYTCAKDFEFKVFDASRAEFAALPGALLATYQVKNIPAVITVIDQLVKKGYQIGKEHIILGIEKMIAQTGLKGRWQLIQEKPRVICDVGHNEAGIRLIVEQIAAEHYNNLHVVFGTVNDKDVSGVLELLPKDASYYFCQANIPRAMPSDSLALSASKVGLKGNWYRDVRSAVSTALKNARPDDLIFVGGSTFVVAEVDQL